MESALKYLIEHFPNLMDINLTATIVIIFVICVRQLLKGAPKVFSYALWGIVLLRLLVPISIESPISFVPERTEFSSMVEVNEVLPEIQFETPQDRAKNEWYRENTPPGEPLAQVSRVLTAQDYLTFVWLFGIAVMLLYSFVSYWRLRRKLKVVVPYQKGIYLADDIDTPFVMGFFRPVIYLPGSLVSKERRYIIAHERHHIRRGDHIFKALSFLALTVHWFNPFVWAAFVLSGRDMEMSCDEAVIRKLGEDVRADYSASLLNLATGHRLFVGTPLAFGEGDPTGRVRNLAGWKKPAIWVILLCVIVCIALAFCLLTDPQMPFPTEFEQYLTVGEKAELLSGVSNETYADAELLVTIRGSSGPIKVRLEMWYRESENTRWILGDTAMLEMQETYGFWIPSGCTFAVAATAEDGQNGYMEFSVYRHGDIVMDEFQHDLLTGAHTKSSRPDASAWTVPEEAWEEPEMAEVSVLPDTYNWGVSLKPDRVSRTGATALFVYGGSVPGQEGVELSYGDFLSLDRMVDGEWVPVDELAGFDYFVGDSSYPVADGYGMVHEWTDRFGELIDGTYRMGKLVRLTRPDGFWEERMIFGEFSIPGSILTGPIPLEDLPEKYGSEQAMLDGCLVCPDGIARDNIELFREFADACNRGKAGFFRVMDYYYGDDPHYIVHDIHYDGNKYTVNVMESGDGRIGVYEFPYLKHFTGTKEREQYPYDAYEYYGFVHDADITWQEIFDGKYEGKYMPIFVSHIYYPNTPQLPEHPAEAILEFEGEALIAITDFDRLEKIWILFGDAELLGYEPKTHSTGLGLNLILTGKNGDSITIDLDLDNDICQINGEYVFYGAFDEPNYIEKLWYYLDIPRWPNQVYDRYPHAFGS